MKRIASLTALSVFAFAGNALADEIVYRCSEGGTNKYTTEPKVGCVVVSVNKGNRPMQPASSGTQIAPSRLMSAPSASSGRAFANCSEARAAGAAPVRSGDPGYSRKLDRDGDGVGCE